VVETALASQAAFQPSHPAIIVFVIIAKKVQQTMEGQDPKLSLHRVPRLDRLPGCNPCRDHDIAESAGLARGKRQNVGCPIFPTKTAVERAYAGVRDHGDGDRSAGP
jgi:hypothetical protein